MEIVVIKEFFIYLFSVVTCLGVPILIYLTYKNNQEEIDLIKEFVDTDLLSQVNEYKNEKTGVNKSLKEYFESLHYEVVGQNLEQAEVRLQQLQNLQITINKYRTNADKTIIKISDNYSSENENILHLMSAIKFRDTLNTISEKINDLIVIETQQKKNLS
ncbi:hypothetical protein [Pontimicrobium sp. MEBiC01747]